MIYYLHDLFNRTLRAQFNMVSQALSFNAAVLKTVQNFTFLPDTCRDMANHMAASAEMATRFGKDFPKPEFGLKDTTINGEKVAITEEIALDKAFGSLLHFKRDTNRNDPKLLIVAPMSGHYATLLRGTVEAMLPDHDVYITDWKNARDVPLSKGDFGLGDYASYVRDFIHHIGEDTHIMAVCQPTVPTLAAIALMAEKDDPCQPLSMTLIGGPLDTRAAETEVTKYAKKHPLSWFRDNVIAQVPAWYQGAGRKVYPGFLQLLGFMSMNPGRHVKSHHDLFDHLRQGDGEKADKIKEFYDEYLAVCDLSSKFYLETVDHVFMRQTLAKGEMVLNGEKVDPSAITKTALLTVEGSLDDIAAPGQTIAAHRMCANLDPDLQYNHLQQGVGHYGTFEGRRWREEISPRIKGFLRNIAARSGIAYDPPSLTDMSKTDPLPMPEPWKPSTAQSPDKTGQNDTKNRGNLRFSGRKYAA